MAEKYINYMAIVLASGRGSRMPMLTDHVPKLLLPMANLPLYWFPLNMLDKSGLRDCILVVTNKCEEKIRQEIEQGIFQRFNHLKNIEMISIDENNYEELGSADVICSLLTKDKFKKENILVVSGDIVTDLSLENMLEFHEKMNSTITLLLSDSTLNGPVPGTKERVKKYRDFIVLSPETSQLLYLADEDDYGEEENFPSISLFRSCNNLLFSAKYKDLHIYATKKETLKILTKNRSLYSSLKADFIPDILKCQHSKSKKNKLGIEDEIKCFAYICPEMECSILAQCNNIGTYFEANKALQKSMQEFNKNLTSKKFEKATGVNCSESLVSQNAEFGGKCQIKRSIIGNDCKFGQNVKIDNSLIMSGTIIEDDATIKNTIILQNVHIGQKADLQMCVISPAQKIKQGMKISSSTISEEKEMDLAR